MDELLRYWFGEEPWTLERFAKRTQLWFRPNPDVDREVRERFGVMVEGARAGEYAGWAETPRGRLALILLLDQFPRNIFRKQSEAFASDAKALVIAEEGIRSGADLALDAPERLVFYLPLMHSEDKAIQDVSVGRYRALRDDAPVELRPELTNALAFAERHHEIITRFGRYPHRNAVVGRESTPEEVAFLEEPNSSF
jgi:uncharacterized protein (DUF924 family)